IIIRMVGKLIGGFGIIKKRIFSNFRINIELMGIFESSSCGHFVVQTNVALPYIVVGSLGNRIVVENGALQPLNRIFTIPGFIIGIAQLILVGYWHSMTALKRFFQIGQSFLIIACLIKGIPDQTIDLLLSFGAG